MKSIITTELVKKEEENMLKEIIVVFVITLGMSLIGELIEELIERYRKYKNENKH